jgi:hypothetical protein
MGIFSTLALFTAFEFDVTLKSCLALGHRVRIDMKAEKKAYYCQ